MTHLELSDDGDVVAVGTLDVGRHDVDVEDGKVVWLEHQLRRKERC